jgi:hypothetical protein
MFRELALVENLDMFISLYGKDNQIKGYVSTILASFYIVSDLKMKIMEKRVI